MLSHELRSPLNVMLGWIRMLRNGQLDGPAVSRGMEILERNIKLQATLIEELLDLSRIVAGKLTLELGPVDLAELTSFSLDASRPAAQTKGLALNAALQPVGRVMADQQRLQQVISNLLANAVKFTPEGGRIDVRLESAGGQMARLHGHRHWRRYWSRSPAPRVRPFSARRQLRDPTAHRIGPRARDRPPCR